MNNPQFKKLQKMLASQDLRGAENLCRKAIQRNRNDVNMIAVLGAIYLQTGRIDEAERALRRAIGLAPGFAKPYDDLAAIHMRRNEFSQAESLYRKVIRLQPEISSAWYGLVLALKSQGELIQAKHICDQILARKPDDLYAMRLMATILNEEGQKAEAGQLLQRVVDLDPGSVQAISELARYNADQFHYSKAIELYRRATELEPGNPFYHFYLGRYLFIVGFAKESLEAYEKGLALKPESPHGQSGRLNALRVVGRTDEAVAGYQACIRKGVNVAESWWSLSSLRTYSFSDDDIDRMTSMRQNGQVNELDSTFLDFAMGKAMDDRQRYDEAWQFYENGNTTHRKSIEYSSDKFESDIDRIIEAVDGSILQRGDTLPPRSVTPVFIVGMPRSGSTLIEQVLASHSEVEATMELPYMQGLGQLYMIAEGDHSSLPIIGLDESKLAAIGDEYLKATELHRTESKRFFIDKLPDNFLYIGLIAMALPGAKIIDARRNPMDTCVGNYRQWFARGKAFSYKLGELGRHYLQYMRIMQHWEQVLPGEILTVDYEMMVENTEAEIRRILSYCGLPWEDACLNFHQSGRQVTTASSEQVRQPIYKSAVGFWKNYESHLGELAEILTPVIDGGSTEP